MAAILSRGRRVNGGIVILSVDKFLYQSEANMGEEKCPALSSWQVDLRFSNESANQLAAQSGWYTS